MEYPAARSKYPRASPDAPKRLCCAALPVQSSRDRDRPCCNLCCTREVTRRCGRMIEKSEGDPARVKLRFDPLLDRLRHVVADHRVCRIGIAAVEQLAGDQTALNPPLIAVSRRERNGSNSRENLPGFVRLLLFTQELRPRQEIRPLERRESGTASSADLAIGRILGDRDASLG